MNTRFIFKLSAIAEILTGLALLLAPALVIGLLLGEGASSDTVARMLGVGLVSVGVAGFESLGQGPRLAPRAALCTYNVGATVVLAIYGSLNVAGGILLWPVVVFHGLIGAMMLPVVASPRYSPTSDTLPDN